ncbi:MAG TPA: DsbA family oxidoreductase [Longimicrobiales bacterium]|nr:DsbA family oxidoreductase [Longimicrobiales bacterium]
MRVEIYADVVCPWCYIGEKRFEKALERFDGEVDVVYRPFQLDPGAPEEATPLRDYLDRRFGAGAGRVTDHAGEAAAGEGIAIDWDSAQSVNTFQAHRLLRLALLEYGPYAQRDLMERLFAAHFSQGGNVGDRDELLELAVAAGMDGDRVRAYLASDEGAEALREELERARRIGIGSVPTFVIEGKYAVQGGQPPETFLQVLEDVRAKIGASGEPDSSQESGTAPGNPDARHG